MTGVTASPRLTRRRRDEPAADPSSLRILLVEDDEHVRLVLALTLELAGHEGYAATDAEDALVLAAQLPSLDLVVTDVGLPRCSGVELVRRLRDRQDELDVLYITGHFEE